MKTTLELSTVAHEDVCTYWGALSLDGIEEAELYEVDDKQWKDKGDDFDADVYTQWISELDFSMFDFLKPVLKKYGFTVEKFSFFQPREYNFGGDTVDIKLDFEGDEAELKKILKKEINQYLKEERKESQPGYSSLEPATFKEVGADDYAVLWAILKKEDLLPDEYNRNDLGDAFDTFRERALENYRSLYSDALYTFCKKNAIKLSY